MNVVFLDYDGVVNIPMWDDNGEHCNYGHPFGGKVNCFQAVQWVSEFCQQFDYSIVVTSSWRMSKNYKECLINGGLRKGIKILGRTRRLDDKHRGDEIQEYLDRHPEIDKFIIFDDETDMGHLKDHLLKCNSVVGFTLVEFENAKQLHMSWKGES